MVRYFQCHQLSNWRVAGEHSVKKVWLLEPFKGTMTLLEYREYRESVSMPFEREK
jgi:hypothetical protein